MSSPPPARAPLTPVGAAPPRGWRKGAVVGVAVGALLASLAATLCIWGLHVQARDMRTAALQLHVQQHLQ